MWKKILTCILRVLGGMLPPSYCKPFGRIAQKFRAALAACISPNIGKNVNIEKAGTSSGYGSRRQFGYRRKLRNLPRFDPRQERDDGAGMSVLFDQPQIQP